MFLAWDIWFIKLVDKVWGLHCISLRSIWYRVGCINSIYPSINEETKDCEIKIYFAEDCNIQMLVSEKKNQEKTFFLKHCMLNATASRREKNSVIRFYLGSWKVCFKFDINVFGFLNRTINLSSKNKTKF